MSSSYRLLDCIGLCCSSMFSERLYVFGLHILNLFLLRSFSLLFDELSLVGLAHNVAD